MSKNIPKNLDVPLLSTGSLSYTKTTFQWLKPGSQNPHPGHRSVWMEYNHLPLPKLSALAASCKYWETHWETLGAWQSLLPPYSLKPGRWFPFLLKVQKCHSCLQITYASSHHLRDKQTDRPKATMSGNDTAPTLEPELFAAEQSYPAGSTLSSHNAERSAGSQCSTLSLALLLWFGMWVYAVRVKGGKPEGDVLAVLHSHECGFK